MATVFSMIMDGEIPGRFAWADETCVVFATINPIADGHMLVVPRAEVARFTDADDELIAHLFAVAKAVGAAQEQAFEGTRATLVVAGFEVPHLHIHVVPVRGEGELSFERARTDVPTAELDAATEAVRAALRDHGHHTVPTDLSSPVVG